MKVATPLWPNCRGTGWVESPSHSVERTCFHVPDVGVYVCPGCPSCKCACGHMRGEHHVLEDGRAAGHCLYSGVCTCAAFARASGADR